MLVCLLVRVFCLICCFVFLLFCAVVVCLRARVYVCVLGAGFYGASVCNPDSTEGISGSESIGE